MSTVREQKTTGLAILWEYNARVDEAYALHLDATTGMERWAEWFEEQQRNILTRYADTPGMAKTLDEMDAVPLWRR